MRHFACKLSCALGLVVGSLTAHAGITMAPLSSFGGGDGWLSPGEGGYAYLHSGSYNEQGLAYGNGHLYLVCHATVSGTAANIRILNPLTGADLGALNNTGIVTSVLGNIVNSAAVGADGVIYVCNTSNFTSSASTRKFDIYKWTTESSAPTIVYSGNGATAGSRIGDNMAVIGSGTSTQLVVTYNNSGGSTANGYAIFTPLSSPVTATAVSFTTTPPNAGDSGSNVTFIDSTHVLSTAPNTGVSLYDYSSFSGTTGTLLANPAIPDPAGTANDNLLSYAVVDGLPLIAVANTSDGHVSIYDMTNPANPVWLASGDNMTSPPTDYNPPFNNGYGQLAWGPSVSNPDGTVSATLYDLNANQGIQAFVITVPEPASLCLAIAGLAVLTIRGRARSPRR